MRSLVDMLIEEKEKHTGAFFHLRITGPQLKAFKALQDEVSNLLGKLEDGDYPHVTVLYMGKNVPDLKGAADKAGEVIAGKSIELQPIGVDFFPPTKNSEGRTPIIVRYDSDDLAKMNHALVRKLASHITADQFPDFKIHATLGYLPRALTRAEEGMLRAMTLKGLDLSPKSVRLSRANKTFRTYKLGG